MTELLVQTFLDDNVPTADAEALEFDKDSLFSTQRVKVAVLTRGYKRKSRGFQQVSAGGTAQFYGDEALQIKRKFPGITVAVDVDRVEGCSFLANPRKIKELKAGKFREIVNPDVEKADLVVLDDAFQYRRIKATRNIVLTTYDRPYYRDFLLPLGRLRDLRSRALEADMIVVTKCPSYLNTEERLKIAGDLGLSNFDMKKCEGTNSKGKVQKLLFSTIAYGNLVPVFPEGDIRYIHSKAAILCTGVANDKPLKKWVSETYSIKSHLKYPDHHAFTLSDMEKIAEQSSRHQVAIVVTTEKDAQRFTDISLKVERELRRRMFYAPIQAKMLTKDEQSCLYDFLAELNEKQF